MRRVYVSRNARAWLGGWSSWVVRAEAEDPETDAPDWKRQARARRRRAFWRRLG